jgi:hypothetical protein
MDVLEYWRPHIDWSRFDQGAIPDEIWERFKELVQLCHAYHYWQEATRAQRAARPPRPLYEESAYKRRKRQQEWKRQIDQCEGHMYRAAYLAAEKMAEMSYLVTNDRANPAWTLWLALWLALAYQPNHERARCNAAAFGEFRVEAELHGSAEEIAAGWLKKAGYSDAGINPHPYG